MTKLTNWTKPLDLRNQVRRLWDRGVLPAALVQGEDIFPLKLSLKVPERRDLADRFEDVRTWIALLDKEARHYRVVRREINHRILGPNAIPAQVWVDTMEQALALIQKGREARILGELVDSTRQRCPELLPWLARRPLRGLELAGQWGLLLNIVVWLREHPRPGIYLRQVDIPGVHTKFIEAHRGVLAELLDMSLPVEAVDSSASGVSGFVQRYGFRTKPLLIRFRTLDSSAALLPAVLPRNKGQDLTLAHEDFARLDPPLERIFITENEINFLAFPPVPRSMVVFGAGYGLDRLAEAAWLHRREVHYWGDIDTHGFSILDQLRSHFPHVVSLLMDHETLLAHKDFWSAEPRQEIRDLPRLTAAERQVYDDLRWNRLGEQVRLEQELIGFERIRKAIGNFSA
ncbi:Wadjet anti-phage system protein JetD domain-containing protein [Desulfonatronum parangueonense]